MIRYTTKFKYNLIFEFVVEGVVKESDVIGSLLTLVTATHGDYNITKLQSAQKLGKVSVVFLQNKDKEKSYGLIKVGCNLEKYDISVLSSIIETINKVGLYSCKIILKQIELSEKISYQKILKRAIEIHNLKFDQNSEGEPDLKRALENLHSSAKATAVGSFTMGSRFNDSDSILLVEGRRDILVLNSCGITNTLAVGGVDFSQSELVELAKNKQITTFFDGDSGGDELRRRVSKLVKVDYEITPPRGTSVEDLKKNEVYELIKNRTVYKEPS
jgi:5S rRNA maturation endonuclease (ribonuclease M5)